MELLRRDTQILRGNRSVDALLFTGHRSSTHPIAGDGLKEISVYACSYSDLQLCTHHQVVICNAESHHKQRTMPTVDAIRWLVHVTSHSTVHLFSHRLRCRRKFFPTQWIHGDGIDRISYGDSERRAHQISPLIKLSRATLPRRNSSVSQSTHSSPFHVQPSTSTITPAAYGDKAPHPALPLRSPAAVDPLSRRHDGNRARHLYNLRPLGRIPSGRKLRRCLQPKLTGPRCR